MKILITGATGLIGSALIKYLGDKHQFGIVGRDPEKIDRLFQIPHDFVSV